MTLKTWKYGELEIIKEDKFYYKLDKRSDLDLLEDSEGRTYEIYEHILSKKLYLMEV